MDGRKLSPQSIERKEGDAGSSADVVRGAEKAGGDSSLKGGGGGKRGETRMHSVPVDLGEFRGQVDGEGRAIEHAQSRKNIRRRTDKGKAPATTRSPTSSASAKRRE